MSRTSFSFALIAVMIALMAGSATAAAIGTTSQDTIYNQIFNTGDTIPQSTGKLSIAYKRSTTSADSIYKGYGTVVNVVVDTGYDIDTISAPANKTGAIGDTISYAYVIRNLSNATISVYFDSVFHPVGQSDSGPNSPSSTNWGITGSYKTYFDANNDGLWANGDTAITSLVMPSGAQDTVIVVVIIPTDANNGETTTATIHLTDRAPRNSAFSTAGDGWQDSLPIRTNDSRDTQYDTTVTKVAGPNIFVSKTLAEEQGTNSRPGDTLIIAITFDNDGDDTGRGVEIIDAIPSNTWLVANSADSVELPNQWSFNSVLGFSDTAYRVYYDTANVGSSYDFIDSFVPRGSAASAQSVSVVKWSLNQIVGANNGDAAGTVDFDQSKNDNGRVYFRVTIN